MLTKNDLQQAKSLIKEEVETAVVQISSAVVKAFENTATKDDLKNFATKDDLKNFATKDDLKNFATKDDLKNFATKDDLTNLATQEDLDEVKTDLKIVKRGIEILQKTTPSKFDFNDHEKRINRLEKATFPS